MAGRHGSNHAYNSLDRWQKLVINLNNLEFLGTTRGIDLD